MVATKLILVLLSALVFFGIAPEQANGAMRAKDQELIYLANKNGPYLGIVIPNLFELNPLLQHPSFSPTDLIIDFQGRRFRFGTIANRPVILVMTGLGMINAAVATQLLLSLFDIEGVVHYGIAGNANPSLNLGDVTIPRYWAHSALWSWQRFGRGPGDELPLEENGDYTREIGYLKFADFTTNVSDCNSYDNYLNNIWYQPEEVFFVDATPEQRQHVFWIPVDSSFYSISKSLENLTLEDCVNSTTCLTETPKVSRVDRGTSASIYIDNAAYRSFIYEKFDVSPVDMESAAVSLICFQQRIPFTVIRALSDLAGGGSAESSEVDTFSSLAADNAVTVVVEFVKLLRLRDEQLMAKGG